MPHTIVLERKQTAMARESRPRATPAPLAGSPAADITLSASRVLTILASFAVLLVLASTAGQVVRHWTGHDSAYGLIPLFYVDYESNIPTFFSSVLLLGSALVLAVIAAVKRRQRSGDAWCWIALAGTFVFLAMDEAASIHEMLQRPMRDLLGNQARGLLHFSWVIVGLAGVMIFSALFLRFFGRLPAPTRRQVLLAASCFLGGAIGLEMIGGSVADRFGGDSIAYSTLATLEESLEMVGAILFIRAWLTYLKNHVGAVHICLAP